MLLDYQTHLSVNWIERCCAPLLVTATRRDIFGTPTANKRRSARAERILRKYAHKSGARNRIAGGLLNEPVYKLVALHWHKQHQRTSPFSRLPREPMMDMTVKAISAKRALVVLYAHELHFPRQVPKNNVIEAMGKTFRAANPAYGNSH